MPRTDSPCAWVFRHLIRSFREGTHFPLLRPDAGDQLAELTEDDLQNTDATILLTDHGAFHYERLVRESQMVIHTHNCTKYVKANREKIVLA